MGNTGGETSSANPDSIQNPYLLPVLLPSILASHPSLNSHFKVTSVVLLLDHASAIPSDLWAMPPLHGSATAALHAQRNLQDAWAQQVRQVGLWRIPVLRPPSCSFRQVLPPDGYSRRSSVVPMVSVVTDCSLAGRGAVKRLRATTRSQTPAACHLCIRDDEEGTLSFHDRTDS
jgi:hypothetical protein